MLAISMTFLGTAIASPLAGSLIDRYGVRGVISVGSLIAGLGFASLYYLSHLWHLYAAAIVIGLGMAAVGAVPASMMVINWFVKHRGTAIGIMSAGIGVGMLVMAPILGSFLIPNFGWRGGFLALAFVTWILIPLALFVVRTKPADMGLYPDGLEDPTDTAVAEASLPAPSGLSLKIALGTSAFWLIVITFFIQGYSGISIWLSQVPHLQDIGFPLGQAASAITVGGLGSAIGKFTFGWLCDKINAKYACAISLTLLVIGTSIFMLVKPDSPLSMVWLYSIILGLGAGGWLPTMSMLVSTNFGLASYGAIFGIVSLAQTTGGAIGLFVAGYMYDVMNTYLWAFVMFLALYAIAIPAALLVRRPRSSEAQSSIPSHRRY